MTSPKIYLSTEAYYARINIEEFNEFQMKEAFQKLTDKRNGMVPYEFIEFECLDRDLELTFPQKVTELGLLGSNVYCHHPFNYDRSTSTRTFKPKKIITESDKIIHFHFEKNHSNKLQNYEKYYTGEGQSYIESISFYVDDSTCNLHEKIKYSDSTEKSSQYHLITKGVRLRKPEWYAVFDLKLVWKNCVQSNTQSIGETRALNDKERTVISIL